MADPSPFSTPKRKRADVLNEDTPAIHTNFSFEVSASPLGDGGGSPRTKVAHRFRGLALEGGGGVTGAQSAPEASAMELDEADVTRKRARLSLVPDLKPTEIPETPDARVTIASSIMNDPQNASTPHDTTANGEDSTSNPPNTTLQERDPSSSPKPYLAIERPIEPKPRSRKRVGTPPPGATATHVADGELNRYEDAEIIEPIRAALTWQDDEITIYDPEDADDDGTGINGIGFKPTPAIAYARTVKRKQQLAEYRKREEREARARRSQRRRGSPTQPLLDRKENDRKVRFMEAEPSKALTT